MTSIADDSTHQTADNLLTASGVLDATKEQTLLQLPNGQRIRLATAMLLREEALAPGLDAEPAFFAEAELRTIPLVEERLEVSKRIVATGKVILEKQVHEYRETLDVPLAIRTFDVERVVLNQPVETAPAVRQEGMTTIYPLVEEQLVLTTQLVLKEELRVTQRDTERRDDRTVTLHRESMTVTRSAD